MFVLYRGKHTTRRSTVGIWSEVRVYRTPATNIPLAGVLTLGKFPDNRRSMWDDAWKEISLTAKKRLTWITSNRSDSIESKNRFAASRTGFQPTQLTVLIICWRAVKRPVKTRCAEFQPNWSPEKFLRSRHVVFVKIYALLQQWFPTCAMWAASMSCMKLVWNSFFAILNHPVIQCYLRLIKLKSGCSALNY